MSRYVIEGQFWYAGDNVYVESKEREENGLPIELCLNDFLKKYIKEETKISIVINTED